MGPASQCVFSVGKIEVLKAIAGVLIVGLGREEGLFLSEWGLLSY